MLEGVITALVTPFKENKEVNYDVLISLIERQIEAGVQGVLIGATSGEGELLSLKEKVKMIKLAKWVSNKRIKILASSSKISVNEMIKEIKVFSSLKVDAILTLTPIYLLTTPKGILKTYETLNAVTKVPLIIYNVPKRTGVKIPLYCFKELSNMKSISGIKEASGDLEYLKGLRKYLTNDFKLYLGDDNLLIEGYKEGASGIISVFSNSHPLTLNKLVGYLNQGKLNEAKELFSKYQDYLKLLFIEPNPIPIKEAMNFINYNVGKYRLPLTEMSLANKEVLINELKRVKE